MHYNNKLHILQSICYAKLDELFPELTYLTCLRISAYAATLM